MRDIKWYLSFDLQKLSWLCNANQTPMKIFMIILVRWNVTLEQMEVRLSVLKYLSTVFTSYHILYQWWNKIQLWTIHVPILFACNIWSVCGWFIWWRNGVGDRGIIVYTTIMPELCLRYHMFTNSCYTTYPKFTTNTTVHH